MYMWALVPPPDVVEPVEAVRQEFAKTWNAVKGLRPPVHLTLYPPFGLPQDVLEEDLAAMRTWVAAQPRFPVVLKDFAFFEKRSPVIFIDVLPQPMLEVLHKGLGERTERHFSLRKQNGPFHPHFTIGYRDIEHRAFPAIKAEYSARTFDAAFEATAVVLFRHNGMKWEAVFALPLGV